MMNLLAGVLMLLLFTEPAAISSLNGIGIGDSLDDARAKLARIGTGDGRDTRDGGRKEAWTLRETEFATLAFKTDKHRRITWVSAFVRPGKELPFARLGKLAKATTFTETQAIWNVTTPEGGYRLVAKGARGKASVVYLLSLDFVPSL